MIHDHDRSGWFGASDVSMIMGNWKTKTFGKWWLKKLGLDQGHFTTTAMNAGTYFEHAVLEEVGAPRMDHQIIIPEYSLRVNLDGDGPGRIWEVKTHKADKPYRPTKAHRQQVMVQMYAKLREEGGLPAAEIVSYGLTEEEYRNFFIPVDPGRLARHPVAYDPTFVAAFLRRAGYLQGCMVKGAWPDEDPQ